MQKGTGSVEWSPNTTGVEWSPVATSTKRRAPRDARCARHSRLTIWPTMRSTHCWNCTCKRMQAHAEHKLKRCPRHRRLPCQKRS